jgi:hypothetical protein
MPLKEDAIATLSEPAYGPIFGMGSDIRVCDRSIYSHHHVYLASYERIEVMGVSTRGLLLGGIQDDL